MKLIMVRKSFFKTGFFELDSVLPLEAVCKTVHHYDQGYGGQHMGMWGNNDMRSDMRDIHLDVLTELSKKNEKEVSKELETKSISQFLEDNKINTKNYKGKYKRSIRDTLDKFVESEDLTKKHADFMFERITENSGRGFGGCGGPGEGRGYGMIN